MKRILLRIKNTKQDLRQSCFWDIFVKREYLKESIRRLESITQQGYYAKMAVAWAVSVYFAAFPDEMLTYLQDGHKLDEFTYKKSLQKITESYRVDKEMKKIIKEMRQRG